MGVKELEKYIEDLKKEGLNADGTEPEVFCSWCSKPMPYMGPSANQWCNSACAEAWRKNGGKPNMH